MLKPVHIRIFKATGLTFLLSAQAFTQTHPNAGVTSNIVNRAAKSLFASNRGQVGLSVGVFMDGKAEYFNYGETNRGNRRRPTAHTLYRIASITKIFTSNLLAQAVTEHKVRLEDDMRKYIQGSYPNLEFEGKPIQLQYLTNHRSGLPFLLPDKPELMPDYKGSAMSWSQRVAKAWKGYTREDIYRDLHSVKLTAAPNTRSSYSNAAPQVLGYILEAIYGKSYEGLLKEKITKPLDLPDTTISLSAGQQKRLAEGYDEGGNLIPPPPDFYGGAGAIKSTIADMMKFLIWQISENSPAVRLSHKPVFTVGDYSAGLNWQMMQRKGSRLIWQSGNFPGFQSLIVMEPELHIGLVLLSNQQDLASPKGYLQDMANQVLKSFDPRAIPLP
jgi:D-alanyl-D-alanine-carboxypeptidase/D-alanyl-D-alanine-endopeptidase